MLADEPWRINEPVSAFSSWLACLSSHVLVGVCDDLLWGVLESVHAATLMSGNLGFYRNRCLEFVARVKAKYIVFVVLARVTQLYIMWVCC